MIPLLLALALAAQGPPASDDPVPPGDPPPESQPPVPRPIEPRPIEPRDDASADAAPDGASADTSDDTSGDESGDESDESQPDEADGEGDSGIEVGPAEEDPVLVSESRLTLGGRLGAAGGNVLAVPFFLPGPGAFLSGSGRLVAVDHFFVGGDVGLSLGINANGDFSSIAGYKGRLSAGLQLPIDVVTFEVDMHGGLTSVALVPVPRLGVGGAIKVALPIGQFMTLDAEANADLDFLVIVPAPAASLEGGATFWLGDAFFARVRTGIDGDALIAIVANSVSASVFLLATVGLDLDLL